MTPFLVGAGLLVPALLVAGLVVLAVGVAAGRGESDPSGGRALAFYLFAVSFVALFTLVLSSSILVTSAMRFAGHDTSCLSVSSGSGAVGKAIPVLPLANGGPNPLANGGPIRRRLIPTPIGNCDGGDGSTNHDADWRAIVGSGLVALVAAGILAFHLRRGWRLFGPRGGWRTAGGRVWQGYLYFVCFAAVLTVLAAGSSAGYSVFRIAAPGVSGSSNGRVPGARSLVTDLYLTVVALVVFAVHWRPLVRLRTELHGPGGPPLGGPFWGGPGRPPTPPSSPVGPPATAWPPVPTVPPAPPVAPPGPPPSVVDAEAGAPDAATPEPDEAAVEGPAGEEVAPAETARPRGGSRAPGASAKKAAGTRKATGTRPTANARKAATARPAGGTSKAAGAAR